MARYDKYDPVDGGFRAPLAFAVVTADLGVVIGVGLNASGAVVRGAGNSGIKGVICPDKTMAVSQVTDVMTDGEIVDMQIGSNGAAVTMVAGANYFVDGATGALAAGTGAFTGTGPATAGSAKVGCTVESTRLVVRNQRV